MRPSSAARTNLDSNNVRITNKKLGEGTFRVCLEGKYVGGNRNQQVAACKRFKPEWRAMEHEYFANDFRVAETVIYYADQWNSRSDRKRDEKILVTKGHLITSNSGLKYLAEPVIREYKKFTSNSGWINNDGTWMTDAMEAFSHYTYHKSGGQLLVCDLQGRYRDNRRYGSNSKSRFELTDPAICSRSRSYGVTDLSEKGIESFFANHSCNGFCQSHWVRPRLQRRWFPNSSATSMFSSSVAHTLKSNNRTQFIIGRLGAIVEQSNGYDYSSSDDDSW